MTHSDEPVTDLLYGLDARPPLRETLFVALQHVFAVFVGMVTPPLVIAGALKLGSADTAYLVSMSLFVSGAATILQVSRLGPIGSGLLSIQGTSFTFIAPIISVAGSAMAAGATAAQALGGIFGLCMAGALVVVLVSRFILRASAVITPVVTGTAVTLIGLTLIEVGMVSVGGGYGARADGSFGSLQNLGLAGLVLMVILVFNTSRSPRLRMLSVVLGLLAGYIAALVLGRLNLSAMRTAPWLNVPLPFRFGVSLDFSAILPFLFMYLITVMESIGDLTATSSLTGQPISGPVYFKRLQGGLLADGINSLVGACLNSFPSTTFAQNNGVIQLTGVGSRYVGIFIGGILMLLGLIPAVGVLVQALPPSALGGATLILFGMVAASGVKILAGVPMNRRNVVILATSLGVGLGVTFVPEITQALPAMARNALSSGIATGGMCALLMNIVLPGERQ
ncbi:MAG TPA: nucleobase:cation symporter-2 family protein [Steroidobacteraceae bacterium]|nr:nucleobase:cation symporter-2 family protein [Steroidobacteraceae bacterium]